MTVVLSATSSPSVSSRNNKSGALATQTPPCPTAIPDGMFSPSAKTLTVSALPSPSVSSRILILSRPGPGSRAWHSGRPIVQVHPCSRLGDS
jgi:hypothetical protein